MSSGSRSDSDVFQPETDGASKSTSPFEPDLELPSVGGTCSDLLIAERKAGYPSHRSRQPSLGSWKKRRNDPKKFSSGKEAAIKRYLQKIDPDADQSEVKMLQIATYCTNPVYEYFLTKNEEVRLFRLKDLIGNIVDTIEKWKEASPGMKSKGKNLVLPAGTWPLAFLDFLSYSSMLEPI